MRRYKRLWGDMRCGEWYEKDISRDVGFDACDRVSSEVMSCRMIWYYVMDTMLYIVMFDMLYDLVWW